MDKKLPYNDKIDPQAGPEKAVPASPAFAANPKIDLSQNSIGAYGRDISITEWDKAAKESKAPPLWTDDPKKRLAIRTFSRGVLGAAFFTLGGAYATRSMKEYNAAKPLAEIKISEPLHILANLIDKFVGKPIEWTVNAMGGNGANAIRFRPTNWSRHDAWGRSLGDEVVKVTFDFFSASIGDAMGRDIAAMVDPNVLHSKDPNIRPKWLDDKGHFHPTEAVKSLLKNTWRYLSYNGGEDWAVAIPYVYYMRAQRHMINHFSPGFYADSDRAGNGAGFKLRTELAPGGKTLNPHPFGDQNPKIIGNFNKEGAIDFQGRFTAYNILTLMYREGYNYIANKWKDTPDSLYGAPDKPAEHRGLLGNIGHLAKWCARSVVKGVIVMTPVVPFFWITRVPQSKYKATFIDQDYGHLSHFANGKDGRRTAVHANFIRGGDVSPNEAFFLSEYRPELHTSTGAPFSRRDVNPRLFEPVMQGKQFNPYEKSFGRVDSMFNAVGKFSNSAARSLDGLAERADKRWGSAGKEFLGIPKTYKEISRNYVNAAMSYTPYMYAKAEAAHLWDNGKTDLAAERMIDGIAHLNWGEFKSGLGEVAAAVLHEPFSDPVREKEAQRRVRVDTSAAETFDREQELIEEQEDRAQLASAIKPGNWRERVISAAPEKKPVRGEGAALEDTYKIASRVTPERKAKYAEQEEMRKALEELQPPTNAIN